MTESLSRLPLLDRLSQFAAKIGLPIPGLSSSDASSTAELCMICGKSTFETGDDEAFHRFATVQVTTDYAAMLAARGANQ